MPTVILLALVKDVSRKALVSGDRGYRCLLEATPDQAAAFKALMDVPADDPCVRVTLEWGDPSGAA